MRRSQLMEIISKRCLVLIKRERPAGKQRAVKKQKSVETSGSTGESQSESVSSLVSQDYRCKCDAVERAYEAQRKKDLAIKKCEEMNVLVHSGGVHGGHYYAYIRLTLSNNWFKFDDERVTIEDFKRAVKEQYGVPEGTKIHDKLGLIECQRLWMFEERHNHTYRPDKLLTTATYERKLGSSPAKTRSKQDILVLVKLYDPEKKKPKYVKDINLYPILMIEEEILE
ncbi:ubiquitin carboxyl-terminal hydrolase 12 [Tanacetum coccineum]